MGTFWASGAYSLSDTKSNFSSILKLNLTPYFFSPLADFEVATSGLD